MNYDWHPNLPITSTEIRFHTLKHAPQRNPYAPTKKRKDVQSPLLLYIIIGSILLLTLIVLFACKAWMACILVALFGLSLVLLNSSLWTLHRIRQLPSYFELEMPVLHIYISAQCVFNVSTAQQDAEWYTGYFLQQEPDVVTELHAADAFLREYKKYIEAYKKEEKKLPGFLRPVAKQFLVRRHKSYEAVQGHFWYITHSGDEKQYTLTATLLQLRDWYKNSPRRQLRRQLFDIESA